MTYEAVGFGSHHWIARAGGTTRFVAIHDREMRLVDENGDRTAACDRVIPRRSELCAAIDDLDLPRTTGSFAEPTRKLLTRHRADVVRARARFDELDLAVRERRTVVVNHGEPHRANVIVTDDGPVLIDWDNVRLAPPERDLWSPVLEDPAVRGHDESVSGNALDDALALRRLWWHLAEIALVVHDFRIRRRWRRTWPTRSAGRCHRTPQRCAFGRGCPRPPRWIVLLS
ncbi:MAG: phosphotransferase [Actinomycetota bacterium]